ncbi:hypothetical protein CPB97_003289, partial [Podila verticillata]
MFPNLEDLAIDEKLSDYAFFEGFGMCVLDGCRSEGHRHGSLKPEAEEDKWFWSITHLQRHETERPFLKLLRISFDPDFEMNASNLQTHNWYVAASILRMMPRLRSLTMRGIYFDPRPNAEELHQALGGAQAMTNNGVRLDQFVLSESKAKDSNSIRFAVKPGVQIPTRYIKDIMEMGCFSKLQRLDLDVALNSFWPVESLDPSFSFGAIFTQPALVAKLHLGHCFEKRIIRRAVAVELRRL